MWSSVFSAAAFAVLFQSVAAHEAETEAYQEPFVGWTQEDLDAKWGTDVCHPNNGINDGCLILTDASGVSLAYQPLPI